MAIGKVRQRREYGVLNRQATAVGRTLRCAADPRRVFYAIARAATRQR
jgi:hypothetical protein